MEDLITIWTPVIISNLAHRKPRQPVILPIEQMFKTVEDVKLKTRQVEAGMHNKVVQLAISLDILCLIRDKYGNLQLVSREEKLLQRIPPQKFSPPFPCEQGLDFVVSVTSLEWEAELTGQALRIDYGLEYRIMVLQNQAVILSPDATGKARADQSHEAIRQLEEEIGHIQGEREDLQQKLFYYERDIANLKRGIYKTESRNAALNREVTQYQKLVQQLQETVYEKERQLSRLGNQEYYKYRPKTEEQTGTGSLAGRLKRRFLSG